MVAHTLSSDRYGARVYRGSAAVDSLQVHRTEAAARNARPAAIARPARIENLAVALSSSEPHRDVAVRAQLLAQGAPVARTALLIPNSPKWQRLLQRIAMLGSLASAIPTDVSARVLLASFPPDKTRVEACPSTEHFIRRAHESDLVVVGRRGLPWAPAPLARPVRKLLRRTRTPVLVVGSRPRGAYRSVVVAADLETRVDSALEWARHIAPHASITFLHVHPGLETRLQWAGASTDGVSKRRLAALRSAA